MLKKELIFSHCGFFFYILIKHCLCEFCLQVTDVQDPGEGYFNEFFHIERALSLNPKQKKICTPCREEAKIAIHQIEPESAALAINMMTQQSPTIDDT